MTFEKWQALGNDYVILEAADLPVRADARRACRACARPTPGIGSDGVLLLSATDEPGFVAAPAHLQPRRLRGRAVRQRRARGDPVPAPRTAGPTPTRSRSSTAAGEIRPTITGPTTCTRGHGPRAPALERLPDRRRPTAAASWTPAAATGASSTSRSATRSASIARRRRARGARPRAPSARRSSATQLFPNRTNVSFVRRASGPGAIRARIFERGVGETLPPAPAPAAPPWPTSLRGGDSPVTVRARRRRARGRGRGGPARQPDRLGGPRVPGRAGRRVHRGAACDRASRLERIPPYLFAELERKIAAKRAAGVDVISLGIGDPDRPTPALIVEAMQEAVAEPGTHQYPSNRGRPEFREAFATSTRAASTSTLDPETRGHPGASAPRSASSTSTSPSSIPGDVALAADPGYPVYTGGPLLAGAEPVLDAAPARARLRARPRRHRRRRSPRRAKLMFLNYPNNPTGAVVPDGLLRAAWSSSRASHDILVVHDNAYSRDHLRRLPRPLVPGHAGREGRRASRSSRCPRATT